MIADSSLTWLSSERLSQQLTETDTDMTDKQWMVLGYTYGTKLGRMITEPERIGTPQEEEQSQLTWILGVLRV